MNREEIRPLNDSSSRADHRRRHLIMEKRLLAWWSKRGTFWPSRSWVILEEIAKRRLSGQPWNARVVSSRCGRSAETLDQRSINLDKTVKLLIYWNCDTNNSLLLSPTVGSNCDKRVLHVHGGGVRKRLNAAVNKINAIIEIHIRPNDIIILWLSTGLFI